MLTPRYKVDKMCPNDGHDLAEAISFADSVIMKFRLTYTGELLSSSNNPRHQNKMTIRRALHPQLTKLWETSPVLTHVPPPPPTHRILGGWTFVPLVSRHLDLVCGLEVLMLRDEDQGQSLRAMETSIIV